MCCRYGLAQAYEELVRRFGLVSAECTLTPRYNVAPGQVIPVVVAAKDRELVPMKWGLIPSWAKDEKIGYKMVNARSETVGEKPSFRVPFRKQRCLVLADAYYEWMQVPGSRNKRPFRFSLKNNEPFGFAGLWDKWIRPDGNSIYSYTIITTDANEIARPVHHRMPVIIRVQDEDAWLDCSVSNTDRLSSILGPYPSSEMTSYEVSTFVNSPRNDSPDCMARLDS